MCVHESVCVVYSVRKREEGLPCVFYVSASVYICVCMSFYVSFHNKYIIRNGF